MKRSGQEQRQPPPELLNNDPNGFAWGVWHERTPKLIARIRDAHPYGPQQRFALDELLNEIATGPMQPLRHDAHDAELWTEWGEDHFGKRWLDAPFLWSESYFYRRVLAATDFFEPGPWRGVDPFAPMKMADLVDSALDADLSALDAFCDVDVDEQGRATLMASLWGNQADLGFRIGQEDAAGQAGSGPLVCDDSERLWEHLDGRASVVLVADNAGRELLADLVFVDHLLQHRATSVTLHVKPHPYYVSDAVTADVVACLRRLDAAPGPSSELARRLLTAAAQARFRLLTHDFYVAPWSYHRMPADLAENFEDTTVTIMKGDLNYRRLVGDRDWPPTTPFADVACYFPTPVVTLRTLKSDVVTGLDPVMVEGLDATGEAWRTDGHHALVQACGVGGSATSA